MGIFIGGPRDGRTVPVQAIDHEVWDVDVPNCDFSYTRTQYRRKIYCRNGYIDQTFFVAPDIDDETAHKRILQWLGCERMTRRSAFDFFTKA